MSESGAEKGRFEALQISRAHGKFRKLKAQQVKQVRKKRNNANGADLYGVAGDHGSQQAVSRGVVLDQGGAGGKRGLEFGDRKIRGSFQGCVFAFVGGELPQSAQELVLARLGLLLEMGEAFLGHFLKPKLLELDAV